MNTTDPPTVPTLAVVGHPNKGKSSIVATLTDNASIAIAPDPGTTQTADRYTLSIDGVDLYTLVDTPGFERPNQALKWLRDQDPATDKRRTAVQLFVATHRGESRFAHECELLAPILDGAGILYVVDGSKPFGPDYEAEMEILRWTGEPRMALINVIDPTDYVDQWRAALGQYFNNVREFNATKASFDKRIDLLDALAQLRDDWKDPLKEAVRRLHLRRAQRRRESARDITHALRDMLGMTAKRHMDRDADPEQFKKQLLEELKDDLRKREQRCRQQVEAIYQHHRIEREESELSTEDHDLFDVEKWYLWGLSRRQLAAMAAFLAAAAGVKVGLMVDTANAGMSAGACAVIGGTIGGTIGGATAWFGADTLERVRLLDHPLGGKQLVCGPIPARNFPFVIIGRAIEHHQLIANRAHAAKDPLTVNADSGGEGARWFEQLSRQDRKALGKAIKAWRDKKGNDAHVEDVVRILADVLEKQ